MARCFVGLPELRGKLERYATRYDLAELHPVDTPLPGPTRLRQWRKLVPPAFAFTVVLPRAVSGLRPGPEFEAALETSLAAAQALEARCILLATPPTVRPTQQNRDRIVELAARLPTPGHLIAWEPSGLWELGDVGATADRAGMLAVLDAGRDTLAPGPIAYTRIRLLGQASELGASALARIEEQLRGRREAFVVAEERAAARLRSALSAAMADREPRRGPQMLLRPNAPIILAADDEEQ